MKFFLFALSLAAIGSVLSENVMQNDNKFMQDCADQLGITSEESYNYKRDLESFVDDPKAQNFVKCFFQKYGWIDPNGDFQESVAIEKLTIGVDSRISKVKQCIEAAGDDKADAFIINLVVCYRAVTGIVRPKY